MKSTIINISQIPGERMHGYQNIRTIIDLTNTDILDIIIMILLSIFFAAVPIRLSLLCLNEI